MPTHWLTRLNTAQCPQDLAGHPTWSMVINPLNAALSHRAGIMPASSRRQHEFIAFGGAIRTQTGRDFEP